MAKTFRFKLLTPEKKIVDEDVEKVFTLSEDGEIEFLANHAPILISTKVCATSYIDSLGNKKEVFTNEGVINIRDNELVFCCDSAELKEDIDLDRALAAKERAEKRLKDKDKNDSIRAEASLRRALVRLKMIK